MTQGLSKVVKAYLAPRLAQTVDCIGRRRCGVFAEEQGLAGQHAGRIFNDDLFICGEAADHVPISVDQGGAGHVEANEWFMGRTRGSRRVRHMWCGHVEADEWKQTREL